jgi:hypothetical protein
MTDNGYLDRLERWAGKVLEDTERLPEDLSEQELNEQQATWFAEFFTLEDGWLVASPDDPAMRERLTGEEGMSPEFADSVLAKMRELGAARVGT